MPVTGSYIIPASRHKIKSSGTYILNQRERHTEGLKPNYFYSWVVFSSSQSEQYVPQEIRHLNV